MRRAPRNRRLPASLSAHPHLTYGVLSDLPLTRQSDRLLAARGGTRRRTESAARKQPEFRHGLLWRARIGGVVAGACALLLAACGQAPRGFGVVLWGAGGVPPTGAVVHIIEESTIEDRYLVLSAGADRDEEPLPVARWRIRVYPDAEQATAFAARYAPFTDSYGYAVRSGLPVRAEASATADIVYKLREGQVTKVLERGAQPERVGVYENYWYQVLTEDGVAGYTFGEFLPLFQASGDPHAEAARLRADDPALEHLLATVWRPDYFRAMLITGRYDLRRFRDDYGLFPDPAARVLRLVTETGTREFRYRTVERVGEGRYVFHPRDGASPARFTVHGSRRVSLSYRDAGRQVTRVYVQLSRDVAESIVAEQERRDRLYRNLLERGAVLHSSGYGTIELGPERRFRWQRFLALVPELLPSGLAGTGRLDFRYAPAPELGGSYDTVISFLFDGDEPETGADSTGAPAAVAAPPASEDPDAGAAGTAAPAAAADSDRLPAASAPAAPGTGAGTDADAATGDSVESVESVAGTAATGEAEPDADAPAAPAAAPPPFEPAAELTLLAEYDRDGIRLTPAEPDPVTLLVTPVSRSPVVMYFSFAAAGGSAADDD